jgi:hypothetical protein
MRWIMEVMDCIIRHPQIGIVQGGTLECFYEVGHHFEILQMNCVLQPEVFNVARGQLESIRI